MKWCLAYSALYAGVSVASVALAVAQRSPGIFVFAVYGILGAIYYALRWNYNRTVMHTPRGPRCVIAPEQGFPELGDRPALPRGMPKGER